MKKSIFSKVGAAAMVLTLVTASLVGGTFAKYTSTVSGTATAAVANWKFQVTDKNNAVITDKAVPLVPKDTTNKKADVIVPGDTGALILNLDGTGSEVGFDYEITITPADENVANVLFYSDEDCKIKLTTADLKASVAYNEAENSMNVKKTFYWKLDDDVKVGEDINGVAGKTLTYNITVVANQTTPVSN